MNRNSSSTPSTSGSLLRRGGGGTGVILGRGAGATAGCISARARALGGTAGAFAGGAAGVTGAAGLLPALAGTSTTPWHLGQRNFLPAGAGPAGLSSAEQEGQTTVTSDMATPRKRPKKAVRTIEEGL